MVNDLDKIICGFNDKIGLPKHSSFYEPGDKYVCYHARNCVYKLVSKEKWVCKFANDLMGIRLNYDSRNRVVMDNRPTTIKIVYDQK